MAIPADGAKALLLIGLEQQLDGYQIGVPMLFGKQVTGPTTAPTVTPGSSGNVSGDAVSYKYSRLTISRGETECSSQSVPQAVSAKIVDLSDLVWGSDSEVDALRVYRRIDSVGANLVSNGTFGTDLTGWAGSNWAQAAGAAQHTSGATAALTQSIAVTSGKKYQVTFKITGRTAGTVTPSIGAASGTAVSSNSTFVQYLTAAASGSIALGFTPSSSFDGSIDDIIVKEITSEGSWLHVGTVWDSTHVTTTLSDNLASGSEDATITAPTANQTTNNYGLREIPLDPMEVVSREDTIVVPNELTGRLVEAPGIPVATRYPLDYSGSLRAGHLVPLYASHIGKPTVTRSETEPVFTYDFTLSDDQVDSVSLCGITHLGGSSTKPRLWQGGKLSEIDIASPGNTELGIKAKGMACADTECSPGIPDSGNSGTAKFLPVLRGWRDDADKYTKSLFGKVTTAPSAGAMAWKFKVDSGGTLGPSTPVYYDTSTKRVKRYGAQDEPGVEVLVGSASDPVGSDTEDREPVVCMFPGDADLFALDDLYEFLPEMLIPDSKVAAGYSGQARLSFDQIRYSPARVRVLRGLSAANDYLEFEALTIKTARTMTPKTSHGPAAKRPRDIVLSGMLKVELGLTRMADSREFERYAAKATRLWVEIQIEGPRIVTNPGTLSTTRDLIRFQINHGEVKSKFTVPSGPVKEAITIMAKQPKDGSTAFGLRIVSAMGWNFAGIA